jgi:ABC-2 type transport system permease protein
LCETIGWLVGGALMLGAGAIGYAIGSLAMPLENRLEWALVWLILFNLFCLYIAVGGVAFLISSLSERRARAVSTIFAIVLASFLLNFLAQFWSPAQSFAFLSVIEYYQPANILKTGSLAFGDIAVLLAVGGVAWIAGCEITARRNICTT